MSMTLNWIDYQTTRLHLTYHPGWTRDQLRAVVEQISQMLNDAPRPVHLIIDQTAAAVPTSEFILHIQILSPATRHPKANQTVVVAAGSETQQLCEQSSYRTSLCRDFHFVSTYEQALTLMSQFDFLAQMGDLEIIEA